MPERRDFGHRSAKGRPGSGADPTRLARLKREIASGKYETQEKLELALRNLLASLKEVKSGAGPSRGDESGGERP